jgi:hypothetical protein
MTEALYKACCEAVRKARAGEFDEVMKRVGFGDCGAVRISPDERIFADPHPSIPGRVTLCWSKGHGEDWVSARWIVAPDEIGPPRHLIAALQHDEAVPA